MKINILNLAERIEAKMSRDTISQGEAAKQSGISESALSRVLVHRRPISLSNLVKLCDWLDIPVEYVVDRGLRNLQIVYKRPTLMINDILTTIMHDQTITTDEATALATLFGDAYHAVARFAAPLKRKEKADAAGS